MCNIPAPEEQAKQHDRHEEMSGMVFRPKAIRFYPEDLAKMESMNHDEKMEFVIKLRQEGRYVEVDDASTDE